MRKRLDRPSPALIVSLVALFVALGGTGYAAVTINGKDIKNKTIAGKKLKNKTVTAGKVKSETLTGLQIDEAKLGKVPSAASADSARNADNAAKALTATTATTATSATSATSAVNAQNAATADKLDGFDAAALGGRADHAELIGDNRITAGSDRDLLTVTIDAPRAGFILAQLSGGGFSDNSSACPCVLQGRLKLDAGGYDLVTFENIDATEFTGGYKRFSMSGSHLYPVSAGTHTITFNISAQTGTASDLGVSYPSLVGVYIPFDGAGD